MIAIKPRATVDDLYHAKGKAELVNGELIIMSPTGALHGRTAGKIYYSLVNHEEEFETGWAFGDNVGFLVDLPNRQSFSPDAAWCSIDIDATSPHFLPAAPVFAAEVRSPDDYGPTAEDRIAQKIADYFAAGTLVVWDVDLESDNVIQKYVAGSGEVVVFKRGEIADAEPAVAGWRFPVDTLFKDKKR
jgi:Uma2 family endonuclease